MQALASITRHAEAKPATMRKRCKCTAAADHGRGWDEEGVDGTGKVEPRVMPDVGQFAVGRICNG
jgi:hypothetical protein